MSLVFEVDVILSVNSSSIAKLPYTAELTVDMILFVVDMELEVDVILLFDELTAYVILLVDGM